LNKLKLFTFLVETYDGLFSSDEEDIHSNQMVASESEDEGIYPFRRNRNCDYYKVSILFQFGCQIHNFCFNSSPILKASAIGHGKLLKKMGKPIQNIVTTLHPCVFQGL
jgi:hypothetical protein